MKAFARVALFPIGMFGGLWLAWWLMGQGLSPSWTIGAITIATVIVTGVAEQLMPLHASWNRSHGDLGTDFLHNVFSFVVLSEVLRAAFLALLVAFIGTIQVPWTVWPVEWPWPLQLALALIICELPYYWVHRGMHTVSWLWPLHAVHHSAPRLYWLNAGRFHPIDAGLIFFTQLPVLILLGCPEPMTVLFVTAGAIHGLFQHANIDLRLGPLNHVFAMAELHRWHHARTGPGQYANYGGTMILWDQIFGTRYAPGETIPADGIGFGGDETYPTDWPGQLAAPFRWHRRTDA